MHLRVSMTRIHNEVGQCSIRFIDHVDVFINAHLDTYHILFIDYYRVFIRRLLSLVRSS